LIIYRVEQLGYAMQRSFIMADFLEEADVFEFAYFFLNVRYVVHDQDSPD
jgi:hypothetical protein